MKFPSLPLLLALALAAALALTACSEPPSSPSPGSDAVSLGSLATRDHEIEISRVGGETRFTIRTIDGKLLSAGLTVDELSAQ